MKLPVGIKTHPHGFRCLSRRSPEGQKRGHLVLNLFQFIEPELRIPDDEDFPRLLVFVKKHLPMLPFFLGSRGQLLLSLQHQRQDVAGILRLWVVFFDETLEQGLRRFLGGDLRLLLHDVFLVLRLPV